MSSCCQAKRARRKARKDKRYKPQHAASIKRIKLEPVR